MKLLKRFSIIIIFLFLLVSCDKAVEIQSNLKVIGDVKEVYNVVESWKDLSKETISYKNEEIQGVDFSKLLEKVTLIDENYDIYIKGIDSFMVKINGNTLKDTYLGYSLKDDWVFISEKHPINSRVKHINEIIIVSKSSRSNYEYGLNIISDDYTTNYSIGELLTSEYRIYPYIDGVTSFKYEGVNYETQVMKEKKVIKLKDIYENEFNSFLIMDEVGNCERIYKDNGYLEICDNNIKYIIPDKNITYSRLKGIMIDPPSYSIKNVFFDTLYYLEHNIDVMIIYVDGLSYYQYEYFKEKDLFISNIEKTMKANTVFKPVTNSTFASMITGENPVVHGVLNRDYREMKVDTIFDKAEELNKTSVLIEGDIKILNTKLKPILNLDKNKDGFKDDEIFNSAMKELEKKHNLILVHFHSIDEVGHKYGPINDEIVQQMGKVDDYIKELTNNFSGRILLISDHGMHSEEDGGGHGEFRGEDLFVPYLIFDGGKMNE